MKFTVSQDVLATALAAVAKVTPSNPSVPSLAAATLELSVSDDGSGVLSVSGGDGENWVRTAVPVSGDLVAGAASVSARLAADLLKDLPAGEVSCELASGSFSLGFASGSYALPVFAEVRVDIPSLDVDPVEVNGAVLAEAAQRVAVAADHRGPTPILECVRLELSEQSLVLAATDRYRLSSVPVPLLSEHSGDDAAANVLASQLVAVSRLLAKSETVQVRLGETVLSLADGSTQVFLRLVGGDFPKWRSLLDSTSPSTWFEVSAESLLAPVRRSARMSNDAVSVTFEAEEAEVSGADASLGSGSERVSVVRDSEGEAVTMRFASRYLIESLASFGGREVSLGVSTPERALLVKDDAGAVHLVMPRR